MEGVVDTLGQGAADARDPGQILHPGSGYLLQAPAVAQQEPAALGPQAWDALQWGAATPPLPAPPVARHREAVRLVPHLLHEA